MIFQFDNISRNLGCYESNSVIQWQGITYFLSDDGFYACDGQQVINIGAEKVNRYFFTTLRESEMESMSVAVDPSKNLVMWGYPCTDLTYRILMYHVPTKRWAYADSTANRIASSSTPSVTLEGLDSFSASIDALQTPLDARLWLGGKLQLAGVTGAKIITFSGPPKTALIDTADISADQNQSMITLVKPLVDGGSGSPLTQPAPGGFTASGPTTTTGHYLGPTLKGSQAQPRKDPNVASVTTSSLSRTVRTVSRFKKDTLIRDWVPPKDNQPKGRPPLSRNWMMWE